MDGTITSTKKYILIYGSILGLTWVIYRILRHITDNLTTSNWVLVVFELSFHIGIIVYAIYKFKSKNEDFLTLWQAFKIGLGIALTCTLMQIIWDIFSVKVISPETIQEIINSTGQLTSTASQGQNSIVSKENNYLFTNFLTDLIYNSTIGIVISMLGGAIMQKNRDPFQ